MPKPASTVWFRRLRRCSALFAALLCAAGCSSAVHRKAPAVLRIADVTDPSSFDPLLGHDQDTIGYDLLICQTLIGLDARNRLVPLLVTRIPTRANGDVSPDGRRIVYHLRRGVRFADGVELTSADVRFTYRAILDPRNPVLSADAYRRIASLQTPDRYTVVVRLKAPWNAAVADLFAQSDFAFGILPAHAFTSTAVVHAHWDSAPFGTGPFRVRTWRRGDRAVLVRNPYFTPRPRLERIELRMIPDVNTAFVALRTGEVDVAPLTTPQLLARARTNSALQIVRTPENGTEWISVQMLHGPGSSFAVREAIAAALDMKELRKAFEGIYPQAGSFLPPALWAWHDASIAPVAHDLRRARALLAGRTPDVLLVITAGDPLWARLATAMQQQLTAAGFRVTIKSFTASLFNAPEGPIRNARFTLSIDGWLGGADPEQSIVFTCAQATPDGDNISRYCNPAFERAFADQQRARSTAQRHADFITMQRLVRADLPVIPLYYMTYDEGVRKNVRGFARNMLRYPVAPERWSVSSGR